MIEKFILNNYLEGKPIISNGPLCNASFINIGGKDYISGREANYTFINPKYTGKNYNVIKEGSFFWTDNNLYDENTGNFVKKISIHPSSCNVGYCGLEDFRFIKWNDITYGFCTEPSMSNGRITGQISMFECSDSFNLENRKICFTKQMTEKNWQPIECLPFKVVYSHKPFTILNVSDMSVQIVNENLCQDSYSGSTPVLRYKDGWISLVHKRNGNKYLHYLIKYDKNFRIERISNEFSFFGVDVEFATGMRVRNETVDILASINDTMTFKFSINSEIIDKIFNEELTDNTVHQEMYNNFVKYAIECDNKLGIAGFGTWCTDAVLISEIVIMDNEIIRNNTLLKKIFMERYKEFS